MKRILILGASILQLPAIEKARAMGCHVGVIDYDPNAVGISRAHEFFEVSTIDIPAVTQTALRFRPDGIVTLATDMPMRSLAAAARACGLPAIDPDTALRATDKGEMIRAFQRAGVSHPRYFIARSEADFVSLAPSFGYPFVLKPTDNAGSRGVVLVENEKDLITAYAYACSHSRGGTLIAQEYLRGPEVSVEILVLDNVPHVLQVTDKLTTGAPHFVEMGHSQPSRLPESDLAAIERLACQAVQAVGISCGPAHVEIILTQRGPVMVELGARMGGDCITTHLLPLSTGIDMVRAVLELSCGETPDITPTCACGSAIRYFTVPSGTVTHISGLEEARAIPGVTEVTLTKQVGQRMDAVGSSADRAGFVIARAATAQDAAAICEQALQTVRFTVEP